MGGGALRIVVPAWWCLAALVWGSTLTTAEQSPRRERPFRSAVHLTTITATVVDRDGRLVPGLPREAFEVLEDGQVQEITQFTSERVPVSVGILLDVSDSMFGRRIDQAREAISRFVTEQLGSDDEFALLAFNHTQHLLSAWTTDRGAAPALMQPLRPSGSTALYDALTTMLPLIDGRARRRGAIVVISDGADTASDATLRDVRAALLRTDAFVYAVGIDPPDRVAINGTVNSVALHQMTDQSGGRTVMVHDGAGAAGALADIAAELNGQYLIGYDSANGEDSHYHSIRLRVRDGGYRVRARTGYITGGVAPAPSPPPPRSGPSRPRRR